MSQQPLDYAGPVATPKRAPSPLARWSMIVLRIVLIAAGIWVALLVLHWYSLGPLGP